METIKINWKNKSEAEMAFALITGLVTAYAVDEETVGHDMAALSGEIFGNAENQPTTGSAEIRYDREQQMLSIRIDGDGYLWTWKANEAFQAYHGWQFTAC